MHLKLLLAIAGLIFLVGCAEQRPINIAAMTPEQADCYSRAKGSGSGIGGSSLLFQMAFQNETERAVYLSCMRSKNLTPAGAPITTAAPRTAFLGMTYRDRPEGIEVTSIDPRSEAALMGIGQNDLLLKVGATELTSPDQFRMLVQRFRKAGESRIGIRVRKVGGAILFVAIHI